MSATVYVVGTPQGAKVNQYEAMTNSLEEAKRLQEGIPGGVLKPIKVSPPRRRK